MNGVMTNNLFNGASSSQVTENRAVLNTGEFFQSSGAPISIVRQYIEQQQTPS
jgi:hypothetical protein